MKKLKLSLIMLSSFFWGCQQDEPAMPEDFGYLTLGITVEVESEPASGRISAVNTDDFKVTIFRADGSEYLVIDPFSSAPPEVQLPTGVYYVEAHSNDLVEAAFDSPYYFAQSDTFTIDKEELKTIDVEAKLANAKVAINFSTEVTNLFDAYSGQVEVVSSGTNLSYMQGETREGYFVVEPLAVEVYLSYAKLDGTTIDRTFNASIDDPQPATLYNINVDATLEDGAIVFSLTVDEGVDTVNIDLGDATSNPNTDWQPGEEWVDTRDSTSYGTVQIGNQVWMSENLRYLPELTSDNSLWIVSGFSDVKAYSVYGYGGNSITGAKVLASTNKQGVLYNWPAAIDLEDSTTENPSTVQGACPTDWHLPSQAEWTELRDYLGGLSVAGGPLKETDTLNWNAPNAGATNSTGFNAIAVGLRNGSDGQFMHQGEYTKYWNASFGSSILQYDYPVLGIAYSIDPRPGYSIRCVKD